MARTYSIAVNVCDQCGHRWLPEGKSGRCPSRKCRSTHWNDSGATIDAEEEALIPAPRSAAPEKLGDLMARLGITTASTMHQAPPATALPPVEDDEPALPMCAYTEYEPESGETYQCGLRQHSFKVKHTRGSRI